MMMLIILLTVLILDRALGEAAALRSHQWFALYRNAMVSWLPDALKAGMLFVMCMLTPPVLAVCIYHYFFGGILYGLFDLLVGVVVLFFCLHVTHLNGKIDRYLEARHDGEIDKASGIAQALAGEPVQKTFSVQSNAVTFAVFYHATIEIFAIIFWFVLLGPAGALLYKTATLLATDSTTALDQSQRSAADKVWGLLGWIPFRLVALTYFLAGSFDDAFKAWQKCRQGEQTFSQANRDLVIKTGCGALRHEVEDNLAEKAEEPGDTGFEWVHAARRLVFRSVIIWLVIVAVLSLVR